MIYGYIRVSTKEQNCENQRRIITDKFMVDEWVEEKKSGMIDFSKRSLGGLVERLKEGDILAITELSRLGRSLSMIFEIMSLLKKKNIRCVAIKNNFDLNPMNKNDIISSVLMFAFGLSAQIERELISERTKAGLVVARANGKRIGRQKGKKIYYVKLRKHEKEFMDLYRNGASINFLAQKYHVQWTTAKRFITKYSKMKHPKPLTEKFQNSEQHKIL
ncbi:MAG: recombinase family protein [Treponema sp.]|nr:recombinase family protein [Treponema sp.]